MMIVEKKTAPASKNGGGGVYVELRFRDEVEIVQKLVCGNGVALEFRLKARF